MSSQDLRLDSRKLIFIVLMLSGCASLPKIDPVLTTYPKDKVTKVKNLINQPVPISITIGSGLSGGAQRDKINENIEYSPGTPVLQGSYVATVIGDPGEVKLWIVPRTSSEATEERLLARVDEGGRTACGGDYRLKNTKYYFGSEATLKFLGIRTPALSTVFRCPAKREVVDDPDFRTVSSQAAIFVDHAYFDVSAFAFEQDIDRVTRAVERVVQQRQIKLIKNTGSTSSRTIVASGIVRGINGMVPEHLVVVVRKRFDGSRVAMMQMRYQTTSHERGVRAAGTSRPGFFRKPQPFARDLAYDYARMLAAEIAEEARK